MPVSREKLDQVIAAQTQAVQSVKPLQTLALDASVTSTSGSTAGVPWFIQSQGTSTLQGAGYSLGNAGGWSVDHSTAYTLNVGRRGIAQVHGFNIQKHAVGDTAGLYAYVWSDGGVSAQSDEGVTGLQCEQNEYTGYFHGTVAATTGRGDRKPKWAFVSGNNWTTDGAFMLNISKGTIKGNILAPSVPLPNTYLNYLPVTKGSIPLTTAWGIVSAAIPNQNVTADSPVSLTITVTLQTINGKAQPFVTGPCIVAGINYPEQSIISSVGKPSTTGQQSITLLIRNPNPQAIVFQGGPAGQYISFGANLRFSGMRSSYYALGSLTGDDLIYCFNVGGNVQSFTIPQVGNEAATSDGGPDSDFELFPGAEVVCNPVFNGAQGTLEPNGVDWEPGDLVENPHYPVWGGTAAWITKYQITPSNGRQGSGGLAVSVGGPGFGGGNTYLGTLQNTNPANYYKGNGGPMYAPDGLKILGCFSRPIYIDTAHEPGSAMIEVQGPNNPAAPNADVLAINLNWLAGGNFWFRDGMWWSDAPLAAAGFNIKGTPGANGTFQTPDGKTVTVEGGLIVSIK